MKALKKNEMTQVLKMKEAAAWIELAGGTTVWERKYGDVQDLWPVAEQRFISRLRARWTTYNELLESFSLKPFTMFEREELHKSGMLNDYLSILHRG